MFRTVLTRAAPRALARAARPACAAPALAAPARSLPTSIGAAGRRWASSTSDSSPVDPAETESFALMEEGTRLLEEGDVEKAKDLYEQSLKIRTTAMGLFNLGVTQYYLKDVPSAISSWEHSIQLFPSNADAHTNLASAHILAVPPQPEKALHHLRRAQALAPGDGEIAFNLGAVLEASGLLDEAHTHYIRSKELGVARAEENARNVGAKLLAERVKKAAAEAEAAEGKGEKE